MNMLARRCRFKTSWNVIHGFSIVIIVALLVSVAGEAVAKGGALTVTTNVSSVTEGSPTVDVTLSLLVSEATTLNSAGFIIGWDTDVFALDASSLLGDIDDNDPHQTSYLSGNDGMEQHDENGRIMHLWVVNSNDVMELRRYDDDGYTDSLFGIPGQAYINYTLTDSLVLTANDTVEMFKITLKMQAEVTAGSHNIRAKVIAVSDNKGSTAEQYSQGLVSMVVDVAKQPPTNTGQNFTLDIDDDGNYQPLTDGILIIRYLFKLAGSDLISGVVGANAVRKQATDITAYLSNNTLANLDVDNDGEVKPLTDGILIIRYLFRLTGSDLVAGAVGSGATRTTADEISVYIKSRMP